MNNSVIARMLQEEHIGPGSQYSRYTRLNLKYNPFPKSGTANVLDNSVQASKLVPVDEQVMRQVSRYVVESLYAQTHIEEDKFLSAVVIGDYGSGKTQLLMYVKYLLSIASGYKDNYKNPYVIYLDNPGVRLSELIGGIVSKIGEENFKKYLWGKIISVLKQSYNSDERLKKFKPTRDLFGESSDLFGEKYVANYRSFLSNWISTLTSIKFRQDFTSIFKDVVVEILKKNFTDNVVSEYLYDLISSDYSSSTIWENFSSGEVKKLEKKYVEIINAIVSLVKDQGYTDFYILVDEFEDITQGRLSKGQVDNYLYNLRTLIDHQRQWCLMFAMTGVAFEQLRKVSPPLADRISSRKINIPSLNTIEAKKLIGNYLELAASNDIAKSIFTDEAVVYTLEYSAYITRNFLRHCFELIESVVEEEGVNQIDLAFAKLHLS